MTKATREQLETLSTLGLFTGRDLSSEKAAIQISEADAQGVEADDLRIDDDYLKIIQLLKRRATADLKAAKESKAKKKIIADLEIDVFELGEEIREHKQAEREDKAYYAVPREQRRINDFHEELQYYKAAKHLTKKPTKAEVKAVVEALDKAKPNWEDTRGGEKLLINTLCKNFNYLRTNKPRPNSGKKKKKGGCGKWIVLIILAVILYYMFID